MKIMEKSKSERPINCNIKQQTDPFFSNIFLKPRTFLLFTQESVVIVRDCLVFPLSLVVILVLRTLFLLLFLPFDISPPPSTIYPRAFLPPSYHIMCLFHYEYMIGGLFFLSTLLFLCVVCILFVCFGFLFLCSFVLILSSGNTAPNR